MIKSIEVVLATGVSPIGVQTIVRIGKNVYSDSTGISTTCKIPDRSLDLEILESVKRHIISIQHNLMKEQKMQEAHDDSTGGH